MYSPEVALLRPSSGHKFGEAAGIASVTRVDLYSLHIVGCFHLLRMMSDCPRKKTDNCARYTEDDIFKINFVLFVTTQSSQQQD